MVSFKEIIANKIGEATKAKYYLSDRIKFMFKEQSNMSSDQKIQEVETILSKIILPHI
jgi:hypothetical protein